MDYKNNIQFILAAIVLYSATAYFIIAKNYEFLIYAGTLTILLLILFYTNKKYNYLESAKWGFFTWMVLHMAGGSVYIGNTRLYDLILIPLVGSPYDLLKYDQAVHFFTFVVFTLLVYSWLITITRKNPKPLSFFLILILAGSSIGALNEIIEFSAVILFSSNGVGGYYNTAIDLVANLLGASVGAIYLFKQKLPLNQK